MITPRLVLDLVTAWPFRSFRIKMASGLSFEIRHPEMILVGKTSVRIYTTVGSDQNKKWYDASLMLMETIEPWELSVPEITG